MQLPYPISRAFDALKPTLFISTGFAFGVYTFLHLLLIERKPSLAFNLQRWSDENLARIWKVFGPILAKENLSVVPVIIWQADGVVVDVGPGTGQNVGHFDRQRITRLFLIEPNLGMHKALEANLKKAGLYDISTIIPCGVQDTSVLESYGLSTSTADSIVTVKVLCSVPAQKSTCETLFSFLKPGGQWLVYEHVIAEPEYKISRQLQNIYEIVWPFSLGGCHINRDTADSLRRAGSWEIVDLRRKKGEMGWEMLGNIVGKLVKSK